jgi:hypothetical protein
MAVQYTIYTELQKRHGYVINGLVEPAHCYLRGFQYEKCMNETDCTDGQIGLTLNWCHRRVMNAIRTAIVKNVMICVLRNIWCPKLYMTLCHT